MASGESGCLTAVNLHNGVRKVANWWAWDSVAIKARSMTNYWHSAEMRCSVLLVKKVADSVQGTPRHILVGFLPGLGQLEQHNPAMPLVTAATKQLPGSCLGQHVLAMYGRPWLTPTSAASFLIASSRLSLASSSRRARSLACFLDLHGSAIASEGLGYMSSIGTRDPDLYLLKACCMQVAAFTSVLPARSCI